MYDQPPTDCADAMHISQDLRSKQWKHTLNWLDEIFIFWNEMNSDLKIIRRLKTVKFNLSKPHAKLMFCVFATERNRAHLSASKNRQLLNNHIGPVTWRTCLFLLSRTTNVFAWQRQLLTDARNLLAQSLHQRWLAVWNAHTKWNLVTSLQKIR